MRCKQCIFQEISPSTTSSQKDDDGKFWKGRCQKCYCKAISISETAGATSSNGSGSGSTNTGSWKSGGELLGVKRKYASKPTELKDLIITDPVQLLIMETFPVRIEWSEVFGRYLVATREIRQAELIFQVEPIVAGPTPSYTEKDWICMSCFRVTKKKTMIRCSDCQWPFCSEECSGDEIHQDLECLVLAKAKVLPEDNYTDHITLMQLLRCLLTKHKDPEGWQKLLTMESHVEGRKHSTSEIWERWRTEEIKFIHETLGLTEYTEEEINFVSGVLSMNAFGSNDVHGLRHRHGSYLYYLGAMASHDCAPNTDYEVDEAQIFNLKAIIDIPAGTQITLSYALPFQGTLWRRDYLKDYFFDCCCKRCSDPLEFGSYFSALKCSSCEAGYLLPDHPLAEESPWKCSEAECLGQKSAQEVGKILKDFDNLRESTEYVSDSNDHLKNLINLERLMEIGRPQFHPNHFSMMGVEFELIQKIQYYIEIQKIPFKDWNDKLLEITKKQIRIGQMIWPGWNDRYGRLLYLLQWGMLNSVAVKQAPSIKNAHPGKASAATVISFEDKRIVNDPESDKVIKEVMRIRKDAKFILLTKPAGSYEHSLGLKLKNIMNVEATETDLIARVEKMMKLG